VEDDGPLLRIGLEDVAGTSWWASVLTTLTSQSGTAQLRFVGTVDGTGVYRGATFPAPAPSAPFPLTSSGPPG
jgi:hypothetical protein